MKAVMLVESEMFVLIRHHRELAVEFQEESDASTDHTREVQFADMALHQTARANMLEAQRLQLFGN